MRLEAALEKGHIPEDSVPHPGEYWLASTGKPVYLYQPVEPSAAITRTRADLKCTIAECDAMALSLSYYWSI